ncbi:FAD-dependent monooxygenase [Streptosporangium soli]|nr:FAD-dependent monooxygenase [Streptosporangium sp. KLBMP 9127]
MEREILIAGGGIGGLATALALAASGHATRVLERAPAFEEVGAGIQLAPNATRLLDRLGVLTAVVAAGVLPRRLVLADALDGDELTALDLTDFPERYGGPYVVMHRADLLRILHRACREAGVALETGAEVVRLADRGDRVVAECADGRTFEGAAGLGADGLHSTIRTAFSDDSPVFSGYVAYRGAVPVVPPGQHPDLPAEPPGRLTNLHPEPPGRHPSPHPEPPGQHAHPHREPPGRHSDPHPEPPGRHLDLHREPPGRPADLRDVVAWVGPGLHLVQYPLRSGGLRNLVAVFRSERHERGEDDWGNPAELDERFARCCARVREAIPLLGRDNRWPMYDRPPIAAWARGRVALLGDAAHPMLQYLAQGACQAIEDAVTLAESLTATRDLPAALAAYVTRRSPRTAQVQRRARIWGDIWHADGTARLLRDELLRTRALDDHRHIKWLYG